MSCTFDLQINQQEFEDPMLNAYYNGDAVEHRSLSLRGAAPERQLGSAKLGFKDQGVLSCPGISCAGGGRPENELAMRLDGDQLEIPGILPPPTTSTPFTLKQCFKFCKDEAKAAGVDFGTVNTNILTPSGEFLFTGVTTVCSCSLRCNALYDYAKIDPDNSAESYFVPAVDTYGKLGNKNTCADLDSVFPWYGPQ